MEDTQNSTPEVSSAAVPEPVQPVSTGSEIELNDIWNTDRIEGTSPTVRETQTAESGSASDGTNGDQSGDQAADAQAGTKTDSDPDAVLRQLAKETGIDLNDPVQGKALRDLASTQKFRDFLDSKINDRNAAQGQPKTPEDAELTDIERELLAEQQQAQTEQPVAESTQDATAAPAGEPQAPKPWFPGDVGHEWKSPKDAYAALNEAWQADDLDKVAAIEDSKFARQFSGMAAPVVQRMAEQVAERIVQQRLQQLGINEVVPVVQQQLQAQRETDARESAIAQLEKIDGFKDIRKMFEVDDAANPTLKFKGQEFPNTPMNRLAVENPDVTKIQFDHKDPQKARTATLAARYRQIARIHNSTQKVKAAISPETAEKLVEAGAQIRQKQSDDRVRQSVNSGNGASVRGTKPREESYVRSALRTTGEMELADLFK